MKNNIIAAGVAVLFVLSLVLLTDPFMLWMPAQAQMLALLCVAVLAGAWAGFVLYERPRDERDAVNTMHAGRLAYLSGVGVLTLALVVQGLSHHIDQWITFALCAMVLVKLGVRLYTDHYR